MTEEQLIYKINQHPHTVQFADVIDVIEENYHYHPTRFTNGDSNHLIINRAGENEGSCKIFAFAMLHSLSKEQALHCFGEYFREDVLKNPVSKNHANIRQYMITGWNGIDYQGKTLQAK